MQIVFLDKIDFDKINDALQSWYVGMEAKHSVEAFDLRNPQEIVTVMDILIKFDKRRLPGYMQLVPVVVPVSQPPKAIPAPQPTVAVSASQTVVQQAKSFPSRPQQKADRQTASVSRDILLRNNDTKWQGIISIMLSVLSIISFPFNLFVAIAGLVFGGIAFKKDSNSYYGIAGLVLGSISTASIIIFAVFLLILLFGRSDRPSTDAAATIVILFEYIL